MALLFELGMPSNNAWNGKWTGEGNYYAVIRCGAIFPSHQAEAAKKVAELWKEKVSRAA